MHDSYTPLGGLAPMHAHGSLAKWSSAALGCWPVRDARPSPCLTVFIAGLDGGPHARSSWARRSSPREMRMAAVLGVLTTPLADFSLVAELRAHGAWILRPWTASTIRRARMAFSESAVRVRLPPAATTGRPLRASTPTLPFLNVVQWAWSCWSHRFHPHRRRVRAGHQSGQRWPQGIGGCSCRARSPRANGLFVFLLLLMSCCSVGRSRCLPGAGAGACWPSS